MLADAIHPRTDYRTAGFYIRFARITGQASLLACRQPELRSLIEHLRTLEGAATYHSAKKIWQSSTHFDRGRAAAFGTWIKGQAVLNEALIPMKPAGAQTLLTAAKQIFGMKLQKSEGLNTLV
jgi:hypothetical protein